MRDNWMGNQPIPAASQIELGSYNCAFHRTAGFPAFNSKRINPGAATTSTNLWQVIGLVEIKGIYGEFTAVPNVVGGPTACSFDLRDDAVTVQISSVGGVSCAGAVVGASIIKDQLVANPLTFLNADQCRVDEAGTGPGGSRPFMDFIIQQKAGQNTYIRFTCTTLAANDFTINFAIIWTCRYPGGSLVAV